MTPERMNAYSEPSPDGKGVSVNIGALAEDLVMWAKASGTTQEDFFQHLVNIWNEMQVSISIPKEAKS